MGEPARLPEIPGRELARQLDRLEKKIDRVIDIVDRIESLTGRIQRYGKALAAVAKHVKWE